MSHSLRGTVGRSLLKTITPLWLLACLLVGLLAHHEVSELYDEQQQLFARQLYHTLPQLKSGASNARHEENADHQAVAIWDGQARALVADTDGMQLSPRPGFTGFVTSLHDKEIWRVYYYSGEQGTVAVAQEEGERWELMRGLLLTQLLWLIILPVAMLAIWWALGRGLSPLVLIRQQLQQRSTDDDTPLPTDVPSEIRPLIDAMNQLIARVASTLQHERRFTADAAHELRSPLAGLRVQAELVQLLDEPAARQAAIGKVLASVDRASHLVDELLALSRLEQQQTLPFAPLSWPAIAEQAMAEVAAAATQRGTRLCLQLDGHGPLADGDASLLQLLLRNLLDNAVRYSPPGSQVALQIGPQQIQVLDNGPGIAAEHLARIGERFYRPAGQDASGSGLGLSIVGRIASLHRLQLAWHNRPEGGLCVTLQPRATQ
ncbi:ATP-binding protein [Vogesella sp. DC21W]|uniref:histidine kinase n=1 Tax=Vogesella aquatica TaxID=2984206 RepID=A0ABT5IZJ4_9NEIS|nr:ATP-binding protein [Vogesella aquatica]MDC7717987.1 ATP-binding protein [Vogesella aquatica]